MANNFHRILGIAVLLLIKAFLNSTSGCPQKCSCYTRSWLITNCRGKYLTSFPDQVDNTTVELILTYNRLKALPPYPLQLENLTILDLHDNRINNLSNCASLKGLRRLTILYLSNNFLDSIPGGCFLDLKSLKHLYLYNNQLRMLTPGMLRGPEGLQSLFVGDNQIKKVADDVFQNVSNGFKLDIGRNKMNGVPDAVKRVMDRLSYLDLSSCSISSFEGLVRQPNTGMISL
ncbi:reticulon-4 receptor-like 2 [Nematostella vectensis]|uniref:reticulon-4 receptor-like 2 n=1 Tax=Nematostella vectensis TaxID=45351 RepID=UPI0013904DE2|nr:reticulon-4 receptor-like 2 [Nematostella vectensis]